MEDLAKNYTDLTVIKVDVVKWGSPVAKQYNLRSIPAFLVYGKNGKVAHTGQEAKAYFQRLVAKAKKKKGKKKKRS